MTGPAGKAAESAGAGVSRVALGDCCGPRANADDDAERPVAGPVAIRFSIMTPASPVSQRMRLLALCLLAGPIASCTTEAYQNLGSPRADFGPGGQLLERVIHVGFINNTPYRAIFTFGAYDQLDQESIPTGFGQLRLEGNTSSGQIAQPCRQTFSVGGAELIRLIEDNEASPLINVTDPQALVDGVNFSSAPPGDPLAAEPTEGKAVGSVVLSGVDFTCTRTDIQAITGTGLLIFTFEQDAMAPGGFRIDFSFVAP